MKHLILAIAIAGVVHAYETFPPYVPVPPTLPDGTPLPGTPTILFEDQVHFTVPDAPIHLIPWGWFAFELKHWDITLNNLTFVQDGSLQSNIEYANLTWTPEAVTVLLGWRNFGFTSPLVYGQFVVTGEQIDYVFASPYEAWEGWLLGMEQTGHVLERRRVWAATPDFRPDGQPVGVPDGGSTALLFALGLAPLILMRSRSPQSA